MNQLEGEWERRAGEVLRRAAVSVANAASSLSALTAVLIEVSALTVAMGVDASGPRPPHQTRSRKLKGAKRQERAAAAVPVEVFAPVELVQPQSPIEAPPEPAPVEVRYCQRPGCENEIPHHTAKGKPLKPAQYATRVYCSQRCSGLVSGQARKAKAVARTEAAEAVESESREARYTRHCEACGKAISRVTPTGHRLFPSDYERRRYCSSSCARKAQASKAKTEPEPEPEPAPELDASTARRERLEAAKAARRASAAPLDADAVLAALVANGSALTVRGVLAGVTGRINDGELDAAKRLLGELVTAGLVSRSRTPGGQVVFGLVDSSVEVPA